jgi:hypothetical protein
VTRPGWMLKPTGTGGPTVTVDVAVKVPYVAVMVAWPAIPVRG